MSPDPRTAAPLGTVVVLTDRSQAEAAGHTLVAVVTRVATAGAGAVVLREKDLPPGERLALGEAVAAALAPTATALVVASDPSLAEHLGAAGVHLAQRDDPCLMTTRLVGRSCHDATEVRAATDEGVDYATLSPVFVTDSKPGHGPPLGIGAVDRMPPSRPPLYALAGVTTTNAAACLAAGFAGVAVMGAVMSAPDPARVVTDLLTATSSVPERVR